MGIWGMTNLRDRFNINGFGEEMSVIDRIKGMSPAEELVARPWLERPLDWAKIGRSVDAIVGIFSDNDRWIPTEGEALVRELGGKTMMLHGRSHFSGDDGCHDLPELLDAL